MATKTDVKQNILKDIESNANKIYYFVRWYVDTPPTNRTEENWNKNVKATTGGTTYSGAMEWLLREDVQKAIKNYLKSQRTIKMLEMYDTMYNKALKGDVNSAKWCETFFKSEFFEDSTDEIDQYLTGIELPSLQKGE